MRTMANGAQKAALPVPGKVSIGEIFLLQFIHSNESLSQP